jgi:hypothetical protein
MSVRAALVTAVSSLSEEEARAFLLALGQWADNQRNYVEEEDEPDPAEVARLQAADKVVDAGDAALAALADS